jgi:chloride channel protein, CIC family
MSANGEHKAGAGLLQQGDFTAKARLLWIALLALVIGAACSVVAWALLRLIWFFTNLFYSGQFSFTKVYPADGLLFHDGSLFWLSVLVPVVGGLIVGLMARFGSDRIRGHGIPEALEAILIGSSRMSPKVAILKPISSAISIGSGGPFGAEGPIIMTGGALGSIIAQIFNLTAAERKTLLAAGAAGGMTATFGTPVAAVLLAVELLLFELKPRSLIPVAVACAVAGGLRPLLLGPGAYIQDYTVHEIGVSWQAIAFCGLVGLFVGVFAMILTMAVYTAEDLFHHIKGIHWMWWPAMGGLAIGLGGLLQPRALGISADVIEDLLKGSFTNSLFAVLLPLLLVKAVIWSTSLGSGTSGGVLAPLLMIGGGVGLFAGSMLSSVVGPDWMLGDARVWALAGMAAMMGGAMRAPLTGTVFALELTHDINTFPALLLASMVSYGFTVLVMKRSILTEKVARRGYHMTYEYSVDPLEIVSVREVMTPDVVTIPANMPVKRVLHDYFLGNASQVHQAYPVMDGENKLLGVITRRNLLEDWVSMSLGKPDADGPGKDLIIAFDLLHRQPISIFPWESCRTAAERMAEAGVGRLPVVSPDEPKKVVGIVTRSDLMKSRARSAEAEGKRERFIVIGRQAK